MTTRLSFDHTPKMLACRHSGTSDVALFWSRRTHRAAVAVEDGATGERFELLVEPGDNPLDLFEHPYAYASARLSAASRAVGSSP
jgi:hypothetical protein